MQEQEIELRLPLFEINQILESLGQRPYAQVYGLIHKIQAQAQAQLSSSPFQNRDPDAHAVK